MLGLRAYRHLGNLLMATGALPVRDSVLAALERWCDRELAALGRMASGGLPLSHGALDSLEPMLGLRAYRHLGNLLMATGALPDRDSVLAALERWCDRELAAIDHPEHARILRAYRTIIVCLATACLHDEDGLRQADARVQQGVDGVDRDVGDDDEPGGEDHHPLDHWQVLVGDALHHRASESGRAENAPGAD